MKTIESITNKVKHGQNWDCHDLSLSCRMANNPHKNYWCKGCKTWINNETKVADYVK